MHSIISVHCPIVKNTDSQQISSPGDWWEVGYGGCWMAWIDGRDVGQGAKINLIGDQRMESAVERR